MKKLVPHDELIKFIDGIGKHLSLTIIDTFAKIKAAFDRALKTEIDLRALSREVEGIVSEDAELRVARLEKIHNETGLDKDYPGHGWYKAADTGIVYNKGIPEGETYKFEGDPKEYVSVYSRDDARLYAERAATSNITNMSSMFYNQADFNKPIGHWDVSNVTDMSQMFYGAKAFNQDIGNWQTSNVGRAVNMFYGATSFNQPIGNWDTSSVTDMSGMFLENFEFNQDISGWDVSKVTDMGSMFWSSKSFNQDLSQWCVPLITTAPRGFDTQASNWTLPRPVWGTCPRGEDQA